MSRMWAYLMKETGFGKTGTVKAPANAWGNVYTAIGGTQTIDGVENVDYILPDIENQALNIVDTNNAATISSYASAGGVRLMDVVGYNVAGSWSTKLYDAQAPFLLDLALRKKHPTTNPLGDLPSFRVDHCHWDSDHITPGVHADSFKGMKIGQFGITAGATSPYVQCVAQLVGSCVVPIPVSGSPAIPTYAKEPPCDKYPINPYTFKHVSVYVDFNAAPMFPSKVGAWNVAGIASKKVTRVTRSVSMNFANQLSTSSHEEGIVDRIQRTITVPSYSFVFDMMNPGSNASGTPLSAIWRDRYRLMRSGVSQAYMSVAVVLDNGIHQIIFDFGVRSVLMSVQKIMSIPEIFSVQIAGSPLYDPALCGTFDWTIQDTPV